MSIIDFNFYLGRRLFLKIFPRLVPLLVLLLPALAGPWRMGSNHRTSSLNFYVLLDLWLNSVRHFFIFIFPCKNYIIIVHRNLAWRCNFITDFLGTVLLSHPLLIMKWNLFSVSIHRVFDNFLLGNLIVSLNWADKTLKTISTVLILKSTSNFQTCKYFSWLNFISYSFSIVCFR